MVTPGRRMGPGSGVHAQAAIQGRRRRGHRQGGAVGSRRGADVLAEPDRPSSGMRTGTTSVTGSDNEYLHRAELVLDRRSSVQRDASCAAEGPSVSSGPPCARSCSGRRIPIGIKIRLRSPFVPGDRPAGEPRGRTAWGNDQDDVIVLPLRTFQRRVAGNQDVSLIQVSVRDGRLDRAGAAQTSSA